MKPPLFSLLLVVGLALSQGVARAEKADRNKPMNVEADALRYDDAKQTSVFSGRVVLTKGTILIRGARMEVRQDTEGNQFGVVTAEPGKLASFRQKREELDEYIEGEGETIQYDSRADSVTFIGKAQLRRFRGAALSDEMTGAVIAYNNATDVFTVDGASARGNQGVLAGRVRAMLTPTPEAGASAPAKPASASAPLVPGSPLRATTTLGGDKK